MSTSLKGQTASNISRIFSASSRLSQWVITSLRSLKSSQRALANSTSFLYAPSAPIDLLTISIVPSGLAVQTGRIIKVFAIKPANFDIRPFATRLSNLCSIKNRWRDFINSSTVGTIALNSAPDSINSTILSTTNCIVPEVANVSKTWIFSLFSAMSRATQAELYVPERRLVIVTQKVYSASLNLADHASGLGQAERLFSLLSCISWSISKGFKFSLSTNSFSPT